MSSLTSLARSMDEPLGRLENACRYIDAAAVGAPGWWRRGGVYAAVAPGSGYSVVAPPVSSATVRIVANRPASAYSVRARMSSTCSVRGSARISPAPRPGCASQCSIGDVAVASVTNVTPKPKSEATLAVVSQHCSVLMPQMTTSLTPWLVRTCCRFVVVNALFEVLVITG